MKIEVKLDTTELEAALTGLTNAMRDTTPLMQGLAQVMAEASDRAFANEVDPITGAKWPKLHPDYKAQGAEAGHTGPMLQRDGTLRTSMHQENGHLYARYGTNLTYAAIHCFGGITRAHWIRPRDKKALAWRKGIRHLVMGVCETDFSGYPDCRDDTVKAMQVALNLGMDARFVVHTPLMWLDKARTWTLAEQEGGAPFVECVRTVTHTCYIGDRGELHPWGYGCGQCPACKLREHGWKEYSEGK